LNKPYSKPKES